MLGTLLEVYQEVDTISTAHFTNVDAGSERTSHMPKVTQMVSDEIGAVLFTLSSYSKPQNPHSPFCLFGQKHH